VASKYGARNPSHPKNRTQRVVTDSADGSDHLQVFMNGSWMHDYRCKDQTNKPPSSEEESPEENSN
jgi:hypothetical protein